MQLWFYLFASASLALPKVVMKYLFHYFWKPISPFSKFCVNCLLRFYFVYCDSFVLKDIYGAGSWTCSLVALRVPEKCFWPAKTRNNLNFFEMHTCLRPGAQILFRHKWKKLASASFSLHCADWYSFPGYWNEFFYLCFRFWIEVLSYCTFTETFAI